MSSRGKIRPAVLADTDALVSCIDAAYAQYASRIDDLPDVSGSVDEQIAKNRAWVTTENSAIIGGIFLKPQTDNLKIMNIVVHPDHIGKGLGRELMGFAERHAIERGFSELRLRTHAKMHENIAMYQHFGWIEFSREGNSVSMRKLI